MYESTIHKKDEYKYTDGKHLNYTIFHRFYFGIFIIFKHHQITIMKQTCNTLAMHDLCVLS